MRSIRFALPEIDVPEVKQKFGRDAEASLLHMRTLKRATAETVGEDLPQAHHRIEKECLHSSIL